MKRVINCYRKLKTKSMMKYLDMMDLRNEKGIVAIEYALIAAAIAVAIAIIVWAIGAKVQSIFILINSALG